MSRCCSFKRIRRASESGIGISELATPHEEPRFTYDDEHAREVFDHYCTLQPSMHGEQTGVNDRKVKDNIDEMYVDDVTELTNYLMNHKEINLRKSLLIGHMIKLKSYYIIKYH